MDALMMYFCLFAFQILMNEKYNKWKWRDLQSVSIKRKLDEVCRRGAEQIREVFN